LTTANYFDEEQNYTFVISPNQLTSTQVCFAAGTLIRTPKGDLAVETLKPGDLVVTASGAARPVKWIGHRDIDFRLGPELHSARPIRIAADAFGPDRPSQDLYLSPGHSICVDIVGEMFVPIGYLVNGATIARAESDTISYWHVELDSHDVLLANNLPAESYLAMGNRGSFEEMRGLLPAILDGGDRTHADFCRPVLTEGPVLEFVRQRLVARAEEIGWGPVRDPDLRLMVDGRIVRPLIEDGVAAFLFPASARDVRVASATFTQTTLGKSDNRSLGLTVVGLSFSASHGGEPRRVRLDDERLRDGFYAVEMHGSAFRRWTTGEAILAPELWEGLSGQIALLITYDRSTIRGWTAPARKAASAEAMPKLYAIG
jgi:hypothetical protein